MSSLSPQEILNKSKNKLVQNNLKPNSSKRGLSQMFKPQSTENVINKKITEQQNNSSFNKKRAPRKNEDVAIKINTKNKLREKNIIRESKVKNKQKICFENLAMNVEQFETLLKFTSKLYSHDYKLFFAILKKTNSGQIEDVSLSDIDIVEYGLRRGKDLKVSRENLAGLGLIKYREGYKSEKSNRKSFFYTISNPDFF